MLWAMAVSKQNEFDPFIICKKYIYNFVIPYVLVYISITPQLFFVSMKGKRIKPECLAEMDAWRHNLLEDYQITPDLVLGCKDEINQHCGKQLEKNGKTLHCLMDLAKPEYSGRTVIKKISDTCNTQVDICCFSLIFDNEY